MLNKMLYGESEAGVEKVIGSCKGETFLITEVREVNARRRQWTS